MNITWKISQLDRSLPDGLVLTAHWRCEANEGGYYGSAYGTQSFPAKDPSDPSYVPYEQITEALAISWVHAAMGMETVAAYEAAVANQIAAQQNPTKASGVPWTQA